MAVPGIASEISLGDISKAISAAFNVPTDAVGDVAGRVREFVNKSPNLRNMHGDGFRQMVLSIAPEIALLDPAKQDQARREQLAKANIHSSDAAAAQAFLGGHHLGGRMGVRSDGTVNSARFDGINSATGSSFSSNYWGTEAGISKMRAQAASMGMPWLADDVLRMGPTALQAIREAHLHKESYRSLTKDAGFTGKDVVDFAKFAVDKKLPEKLTNDLARSIGETSKGLPEDLQRQHREAFKNWMTSKPGEEKAAREKLDGVLGKIEAHDPNKKPHVDKEKNLLKEADDLRAAKQAAEAKAEADRIKAEAERSKAEAERIKADAERSKTEAEREKTDDKREKRNDLISGLNTPPAPDKSTTKKTENTEDPNKPKIKAAENTKADPAAKPGEQKQTEAPVKPKQQMAQAAAPKLSV